MRAESAVLAALFVAAGACAANGQTWQTVTAQRERQNERALNVKLEYGAGSFAVRPAPPGTLYRLQMRYDADRFESLREYRERDGLATLQVGVKSLRGFRFGSMKEGPASLDLAVAPDLPTRLDLRFGAVEGVLELGGMHLTGLQIKTGASDTRVYFGAPNAVPIERCELAAGAAAFRVEGLGNARCRTLRVKGGVGDVLLDFSGEWSGNTEARIEMGIGSLTVRVPEDVGVAVDRETFLSSFSAHRLSRRDGRWVSDNWDDAPYRLTLSIKAVLGSVEVNRTD